MWFYIAPALIVVGCPIWRAMDGSDRRDDERTRSVRSPGCAGHVDGRYFAFRLETVKSLKREGRYAEALELLMRLTVATAAESGRSGMNVAPWYYEGAAKRHRRRKEHREEVRAPERHVGKVYAPGVSKPRPIDRLERARRLLQSSREATQKE